MKRETPKGFGVDSDDLEGIEEGIADRVLLLEPILKELFSHAAQGLDMTIKADSLDILASFIQSVTEQNVWLANQVEAKEVELREARTASTKDGIWTPSHD